jgi:polyferredoxin
MSTQSKPIVRRRRDRSQTLRSAFQAAFLLLNVWIGARFYLFVRYWETGGVGPRVSRPPGVEGWLPIAGLMNLKYLLVTKTVPAIHPAGLFLLLAFLAISFLLRKAFCSWLCPVGTISEWVWAGSRHLFGKRLQGLRPPRWLDLPLRSLKYILLGFFLWAVVGMSASGLEAFMTSPYGLVADVKMLDFFRDLGVVGASVLLGLVVLSMFVQNAWCRFLCPYGALLGLVSSLSPVRIRRDPQACIDCAKCARACPSLLPVDRLLSVKSAECTGCLECVAACPVAGALDLTLTRRRRVPAAAMAAAIAAIFLGAVAFAHLTGHWHTSLPDNVYRALVPKSDALTHPGF